MKLLRLLLATLLLSENLLLPLAYVKAETEEEPIVDISYSTKDSKTPPATEYISQVNAAATNGKTYNFYTLTGTVRTIRSDKKNEDAPYQTGLPVKNYIIVAYDRASPSGSNIYYKDWIAATTTNERGMFALPIEKTGDGVFVVVLKPTKNGYKFVKSYGVSSTPNNMLSPVPYNGLNIGAINLEAEEKTIDKLKESGEIPDSINMIDLTQYWNCGEKSDLTFKNAAYDRTVEVPIKLTDNSYQNTFYVTSDDVPTGGNQNNTLECIHSGSCPTIDLPTKSSQEFRDTPVQGRIDKSTSKSMDGTVSSLAFFNGVLNYKQPINVKNEKYPYCDEFRKSSTIEASSYNLDKDYQSYNGLSSLVYPYQLEIMLENGEIDEAALKSNIACIEKDGTQKSYYEIGVVEGNQGVYQNFLNDRNLSKQYTYIPYQKYSSNDSVANVCPEQGEPGYEECNKIDKSPGASEFSRIDIFNSAPSLNAASPEKLRGTRLASLDTDEMRPKDLEIKGIYTNTLRDVGGADKIIRTPYAENKKNPMYVYEINPLRDYCEVTAVKGAGGNIIKNESKPNGKLLETDETAAGYMLSNADMTQDKPTSSWNNQDFYKDPVQFSLANFISNLVTTFTNFISSLFPADNTCLSFNKDSKVYLGQSTIDCNGVETGDVLATVEQLKKDYGENVIYEEATPGSTCSGGGNTQTVKYYRYTQGTYTCEGEGEYKLKIDAKQRDAGSIQIKNNDLPSDNLETMRDSLSVDTMFEFDDNNTQGAVYRPISVGQASVERYEATGSSKTVFFINKSVDSTSADLLDYTRFSVNTPNGMEDQEMPYNHALVRLINRDKRRASGESFFAESGGGGGGGGGGGNGVNVDADCAPIPSWTQYKQCDSQWGTYVWGSGSNSGTICSSGCGPTSTAMVLKNKIDINPYQVVTSSKYPYYNMVDSADGSSLLDHQNALSREGVTSNISMCDSTNIQEAICKDNQVAILAVYSCVDDACSSTAGHFIVATGVKNNVNGKDVITTLDPWYTKSTQELDAQNHGAGSVMTIQGCLFINSEDLK